jgi:hypothetical protein
MIEMRLVIEQDPDIGPAEAQLFHTRVYLRR